MNTSLKLGEDSGSVAGKIQLFSGTMFNPLHPDPDLIEVSDIAHASALQCRYGGHCRFFYSVAEHSVNVSHMLKQWGYSLEVQFAGLLHDVDESLGLPDVPRPVKNHLNGYKEAGEYLQKVVFDAIGLPYPFPPEVHLADNSVLFLYERPVLMGDKNPEFWVYNGELREADVAIAGLWPTNAEEMFLGRYFELADAIKKERAIG